MKRETTHTLAGRGETRAEVQFRSVTGYCNWLRMLRIGGRCLGGSLGVGVDLVATGRTGRIM